MNSRTSTIALRTGAITAIGVVGLTGVTGAAAHAAPNRTAGTIGITVVDGRFGSALIPSIWVTDRYRSYPAWLETRSTVGRTIHYRFRASNLPTRTPITVNVQFRGAHVGTRIVNLPSFYPQAHLTFHTN